jgi:hypothetical protein
LIGYCWQGHFASFAIGHGLIAARGALDGRALPFAEVETIADQLERAGCRVAARQQQRKISHRLSQFSDSIIMKQPMILRMRAAMSSRIRHVTIRMSVPMIANRQE